MLRQNYLEDPKSFRVYCERRPRVTGSDRARRGAMLAIIQRFERAYRKAREAFALDRNVEFPYGTLPMVERFHVRCATGPP